LKRPSTAAVLADDTGVGCERLGLCEIPAEPSVGGHLSRSLPLATDYGYDAA